MATFDKTGSVALGRQPLILIRSGIGISERQAIGPDVLTDTNSGLAVFPGVTSGIDAISYIESGISISTKVGSGSKTVISGFVYDKTGVGILGFLPTKTGTAIYTRVGSGIDAVTYSEVGAGISIREGSGSKAPLGTLYTKIGSGVLGVFAGRSGTAINTRIGSGSKITQFSEAGAGVSAWIGSGASVFLNPTTHTKSGGGAGGAGTPTYGLISLTRAVGWQASGTSSYTSGGPQTYIKTGSAIRAYEASGQRRSVFTETSTSITTLNTTGPDVTTFVETGQGVQTRNATGSDIATINRTGIASYAYESRGIAESPGNHLASGIGVSGRQGSGPDSVQFSETLSAVVVRTASGAYVKYTDKTGSGTSTRQANGIRNGEHIAQGATFLDRGNSASRSIIRTRSGSSGVTFIVSGENDPQLQHIKTGKVENTWTVLSTLDQGPSYDKSGQATTSYNVSGAPMFRVPTTLLLQPVSVGTDYVLTGIPVQAVRTIEIDGTELVLTYD